MVKHIVLFTLNRGLAHEDPRVKKAFDALRALEGKIDAIRLWEVGDNISKRANAADFALYSGFETERDLADYVDHPAHRKVVGLLKEVTTWQVCDYVCD